LNPQDRAFYCFSHEDSRPTWNQECRYLSAARHNENFVMGRVKHGQRSDDTSSRYEPTSIASLSATTTPKSTFVPSFGSGHLPSASDLARFRSLAAPHVESFNYFLDVGLPAGINDIDVMEIDLIDPKVSRETPDKIHLEETESIQFWFENVRVLKPSKVSKSGSVEKMGTSLKLLPRECRERRLTYAGLLMASVCYRHVQRRNGIAIPSKTARVAKTCGEMPIMTMSRVCHLAGTTSAELANLKEEVGHHSFIVLFLLVWRSLQIHTNC
jgi:hypothetical protein